MNTETAAKKPITKTLLDELFNVPNILTLLRIALIPVICVLLWNDNIKDSILAGLLFTAAAITDYVDGFLARITNSITIIGKFLDPLADKLAVLSVLIILTMIDRVPVWVVVLITAREVTITGLRSIATTEGMVIAAKPLGKYKTAYQLVGLVFLCVHFPMVIHLIVWEGEVDFQFLGTILIYTSLFFSIASAGDYFYQFFKNLREKRSSQ